MPTPVKRERSTALYEAILQLRDVEECTRFFEDILAQTGASSATVSRVNRMLRDGNGTLQALVARQKEAEEQ